VAYPAPMLRPVAAAILLLLLAATPAEARRHVPLGWLGVNADGPIVDGVNGPPDSEWAYMASTGSEGARIAVRWSDMQPARGAPIQFGELDRLVLGAARHGMPVLPVVEATPGWAALRPQDGIASPPRDPADLAAFMTALVRRYGPRGALWKTHRGVRAIPVRDWQVWNEPNFTGFWSVQPYAAAYVKLLRAAHRAIHAVDPHGRTILAGLTGRSWEALRTLYQAGAHGAFDAVALNAFTRRPADMVRIGELARREMRKHHDGRVPIWFTELTWPASVGHIDQPSATYATTEQGQKTNLRRAVLALAAARRRVGIGRVYWYTWMSREGTSSVFDWSGLRRIRNGGVADAPSLGAFRSVARRLEGCAKRQGDARHCR
jgi:hypothetical protein